MAVVGNEPVPGAPRPAVVPPPYNYTPPPPHVAPPVAPAPPPPAAPAAPAKPPVDYLALIKNSPGYQSWLASANQRTGNAATDRANAIRSLALQFGGLMPGFRDSFGDLSAADLDAAQHNQYSVSQGISRADAANREGLHRSLAARGMLQSGDLNYGEGQADLARGQSEHDAAGQFLAAMQAALSGYAGNVGNISAEESGIINQLLPLFQQLYPSPAPPVPGAPPPAAPPPAAIPPPQVPSYTALPAGTVTPIRPRPGTGGAGGGGQAL